MCNHNKSNHALETLGGNSGNVAIIVAICLVALILFTALVVDVGSLYEERRSLQTVADSAALAGAQELPESPDSATQIAIEYAANHGVNIDSGDVVISSTLATNDTITVTASNPDVPLYFARVIGMNSAPVRARAKAIIAQPYFNDGVVPWGVPKEEWEIWGMGHEIALKYGSGPDGKSYSGNFQALALDRKGGNEYATNIVEGASTLLVVGDWVETEPGNKVGPSNKKGTLERVENYFNFSMDLFEVLAVFNPVTKLYELAIPDSQFVVVPIISSLVEATGREKVEILDFAPFIITGIEDMKGDSEYGNGVAIIGKFIDWALVSNKEVKLLPVESNGIRVIRLIE